LRPSERRISSVLSSCNSFILSKVIRGDRDWCPNKTKKLETIFLFYIQLLYCNFEFSCKKVARSSF
jgi:hypothetical protein